MKENTTVNVKATLTQTKKDGTKVEKTISVAIKFILGNNPTTASK